MLRGVSLAAVIAMVLPVSLVGQSPKMSVDSAVSTKGGFHITIHNNYSETAVTFLVGVKNAFPGPRDASEGSCGPAFMILSPSECTGVGYQDHEGVLQISGNSGIPPGGSRAWNEGFSSRFGTYPDGVPLRLLAVEVRGAIFADGTTFGEPVIVKRLLVRRQFMLQDAFEDEQILARALLDPSITQAQLEKGLQDRAVLHNRELNPPELAELTGTWAVPNSSFMIFHDSICQEAAHNIGLEAPQGQIQRRVELVIAMLQQHIAALEASKPSLQPPKVNPEAGGTRP